MKNEPSALENVRAGGSLYGNCHTFAGQIDSIMIGMVLKHRIIIAVLVTLAFAGSASFDFLSTEYALGKCSMSNGFVYEANPLCVFLFDNGFGRWSLVIAQLYSAAIMLLPYMYHLFCFRHDYGRLPERSRGNWLMRMSDMCRTCVGYAGVPFKIRVLTLLNLYGVSICFTSIVRKSVIALWNLMNGYLLRHADPEVYMDGDGNLTFEYAEEFANNHSFFARMCRSYYESLAGNDFFNANNVLVIITVGGIIVSFLLYFITGADLKLNAGKRVK